MQIILIILSLFLTGSNSGGKTSTSFSKEAKFGIVAVIAYFLYNYLNKQEKKDSLLTGGNPEDIKYTQWANRLKEALHPPIFGSFKIPFFGYLPDGTDEQAVIQIATEIKNSGSSVAKFAEIYKLLYEDVLFEELTNEGVYSDWVNALTGNISTTTPPKTNTNTGSGGVVGATLIGTEWIAKGGFNLRDQLTLVQSGKYTVDGEKYLVVSEKVLKTINGVATYMVKVRYTLGFGIGSVFTYYVAFSAFKSRA
jgi:hypothetical protein